MTDDNTTGDTDRAPTELGDVGQFTREYYPIVLASVVIGLGLYILLVHILPVMGAGSETLGGVV